MPVVAIAVHATQCDEIRMCLNSLKIFSFSFEASCVTQLHARFVEHFACEVLGVSLGRLLGKLVSFRFLALINDLSMFKKGHAPREFSFLIGLHVT